MRRSVADAREDAGHLDALHGIQGSITPGVCEVVAFHRMVQDAVLGRFRSASINFLRGAIDEGRGPCALRPVGHCSTGQVSTPGRVLAAPLAEDGDVAICAFAQHA